MNSPPSFPRTAAVIGGGPAGLMAAERLAGAGCRVDVYDRMPSMGRKLLMAGRGGLNLTHGEPLDRFLERFGTAMPWLAPAIAAFPPAAVVAWAEGLGQQVFTGSSGRVFPRAMKASPLLRAWLGRLAAQGVAFHPRTAWVGWDEAGRLRMEGPGGAFVLRPDVAVLALGGASWPRLGSDGAWSGWVEGTTPFRPSNCGFCVAWSAQLRARMAGHPVKRVVARFADRTVPGEAVITEAGIEGGVIYALSAPLRDAIEATGSAVLRLDLRPDLDAATLRSRLASPRGGQSLSSFLRRRAGLSAEAVALVQEALHSGAAADDLASLIKDLPLRLDAPMPLVRAISSAGGVPQEAVDGRLMLRARPGVFVAGEMLDWEAPTGGYLLTACLATAVAAAEGALAWLAE